MLDRAEEQGVYDFRASCSDLAAADWSKAGRQTLQMLEYGALQDPAWLRENVHQHGRKYLPADLIERATGRPPTAAPYIAYLRKKYTDLYQLG